VIGLPGAAANSARFDSSLSDISNPKLKARSLSAAVTELELLDAIPWTLASEQSARSAGHCSCDRSLWRHLPTFVSHTSTHCISFVSVPF